jgi:ketosteroid isomerase-like protein
MTEIRLAGGTEADKAAVLATHELYLTANAVFDWDTLRDKIWSHDPAALFFNMNGRTYVGAEHWIQLWQYYKDKFVSGYWTPFDMRGEIGSDVAVIWCHRHTARRWSGDDRPADGVHTDADYVSRSTMVFRKEDGEWRVIHVHFSETVPGPRPGDI